MISGVTAISVGLSPALAFAMSVVIFAGAAQLAMVQLIGEGAAALVIIFTALMINLRFVMYSLALAPHFKTLSHGWKWLLSYVLTDQAFAISITHYAQHPEDRFKHWYYLGAAASLWLVWQIATAAGILLGAQVPPSWSLDFAIPLNFLALLIPLLKDRPNLAAAAMAGFVAVAAHSLPFNLGLLSGALSGILVGVLLERLQPQPTHED
jgi:4-azaleucine resistance transporter AzlC